MINYLKSDVSTFCGKSFVYKPRLWSLDMKKKAEGKLSAVSTMPMIVHRSICRGDRSEAPANSVKVYMQ